jgi:hypothetical protein
MGWQAETLPFPETGQSRALLNPTLPSFAPFQI